MAQYRTDAKRRNGWRPRSLTSEFDQPVDEGLGAISGGLEENVKLRDIVVPRLQPEQQIRIEEEVHREGNHAGKRVTNRGDLGL